MYNDQGQPIVTDNDVDQTLAGGFMGGARPTASGIAAGRAFKTNTPSGGLYDPLAPAVQGDKYAANTGETAAQYAQRIQASGVSVVVPPNPGETPEQWRARNQAASLKAAQNNPANKTNVGLDALAIGGGVASVLANPIGAALDPYTPDGVSFAVNPIGEAQRQAIKAGTNAAVPGDPLGTDYGTPGDIVNKTVGPGAGGYTPGAVPTAPDLGGPPTPGGGAGGAGGGVGGSPFTPEQITAAMAGTNDPTAAINRVTGAAPAPVTRGAADAAAIQQAQAGQQALLDRVLSGDSTAKAVAEQMAAEQRAQALSARGGAGAVQQAMNAAQANAPKIQQQAAIDARREEQQRQQTAATITGQQAQTALGSEQNQIAIDKLNNDASNNLVNRISELSGTQLQLDQADRVATGQLMRDVAKWATDNQQAWARMDLDAKIAWLNANVQQYGISTNAWAAIQTALIGNSKDTLDKIEQLVGIVA